jgi:membrane-associated phospholipid phosphatase
VKLAVASTLMCLAFALPGTAFCQEPPPDQTPVSNPPATTPAPYDRPVSWKLLVPNLLSDQARIWTFPVRLARGQDVLPATAVLAGTAGLVALDPAESGYFRGTSTYQGFNSVFAGNATALGVVLAPVSLYAVGAFRKDSKMTHTALLAGEAVADAELVTTVLKDATTRVRPAAIPAKGNFSDSWFESGGSLIRGRGSFPSGHTIAAMSVATVVARRYGNHRWVPFVAYGMAALIGFSRLSLSAHFLSDVFMGGALGYSISRYAVLRQ